MVGSYKVKETIGRLRRKELSFWDLDDKLFEEVVFYSIVKQFNNSELKEATYEWFEKGPIDIVISSPDLSNRLVKLPRNTYFIECKYYRSKDLDLDSAAKAFSASIRYKPKLLMILSLRALSRQAREYAYYFFGPKGIYGTSFKRSSLEELLGIPTDQKPVLSEEQVIAGLDTSSRINYWKLFEEHTFTSNELASTEKTIKEVLINPNVKCILKIWLTGIDTKKVKRYSILSAQQEEIKSFSFLTVNSIGDTEHVLIFALDLYNPGDKLNPFFLAIDLSSSKKLFKIEFPAVSIAQLPALKIGDFREIETNSILKKLSEPTGPIFLFIHGEGGVGKTYLSELICDGLHSKNNYRAHYISLTEDSGEGLFFKLIWPIICPSKEYEISNNNNSDLELMKAIIEQELSSSDSELNYGGEEVDGLIRDITNLKFDQANLEVLAFLCARLLIRSRVPQIILFSNCNYLSPGIIKGFKFFINSIEQTKDRNIKIIFEYRDTPEYKNEEWEEFTKEIKRQFKDKVLLHRVEPLTETQIVQSLESIFPGNDGIILSRSLKEKTNGNPLFIQQLVHYFIEKKYINTYSETGFLSRLNVIDYEGITRELTILPDIITAFLEKRIDFYLNKCSGELDFKRDIANYMAVASLGIHSIDEERAEQLFRLQVNNLGIVKEFLIKGGVLRSKVISSQVDFAHDLLKTSVLNYIVKDIALGNAMQRLLERLDNSTLTDIIIGGKGRLALGRFRDSFSYFNKAYEIAQYKSSYLLRRICLLGCKRSLDEDDSDTLDVVRKKINIDIDLGKVETQVGSQIEALQVFSKLEEYIYSVEKKFILPPNEINELLLNIHASKMTLDIRSLKPTPVLEEFSFAINRAQSAYDLSILTGRLHILLFQANLPRELLRTIRLVNTVPSNEASNERMTSHLSDIGNFYILCHPKIAQLLWVESEKWASTKREKTHVALNLLLSTLMVEDELASLEIISALESDIKEQNVNNQLAWLYNYLGVWNFNRTGIKDAIFYFGKGLQIAQSNNLHFLESSIHNNLTICYLANKLPEQAAKHFEKALLLIRQIADFSFSQSLATQLVVDLAIDKSATLLSPTCDANLEVLKNLTIEPTISGSFNIILYNLKQLNKTHTFSDHTNLLILAPELYKKWDENCFKNIVILNADKHNMVCEVEGEKLAFSI